MKLANLQKEIYVMKIFSSQQLYNADAITIENQKIRSVDLMEHAATLCFNWLHEKLNGAQVPIHVFCGIGNNGGDGLVMARLLLIHGYHVNVYIANFTDKRSPDFLINYNLLKEVSSEWPILMTSEEDFPKLNSEDVIIDALFGIGLNRPPEGWVKKLIKHINNSEAFVLSIDIPSGLYSNKKIDDYEAIVIADYTLTFQAPKLSFFLPETASFCTSFDVLDIGLDQEFLNTEVPIATLFDTYGAQELYRPRNKFDHKGDYGHCLIIGGSYGKIGAVILASRASLKIGAGMVTAFVPKCGYSILQSSLPEAMVITDSSKEYIDSISINFTPSAIGIGMGMGTNKNTLSAFKDFLLNNASPLVIDADALNCISEYKELLNSIPKGSILTPHPGELRRLIGNWEDDFQKIEMAKNFSEKHQIILLVKGANTLVIDKREMYINSSGNPGMATAGSGDVLAGVLTGLLSQGYTPLEASLFGVYMHGNAGDIASKNLGYESIIASDIIDALGKAYLHLFKEETEEES